MVRIKSGLSQRLFLPSSIIAGVIGLLIGPSVLGAVVQRRAGEEHPLAGGLLPEPVLEVWSALPELLINVVFATLFLGIALPGWRKIWELAGPQLSFGVTLGAGQYVVGLLLAVIVLTPLFGMNPMAGALIEIGFEGGHGTAAGLAGTLEELDFPEGGDLALGLATVGVVSGIVIGVALINWGVRNGRAAVLDEPSEVSEAQQKGIIEYDGRVPAGEMTVRPESIEPLSYHFSFVAIAIFIGVILLEALILLEANTWGAWTGTELLTHVPLFPLAMLGGVVVQLVMRRVDRHDLLDRETMLRIQGFALDLLIATAIATLSLEVIGANLVPFVLLAVAGIAWNVLLFLFLAPRVIPDFWFERAVGDLGQSMGVTATGLVLIKIADPSGESPAMESFGYKQLGFEPFLGGGLLTGISAPLIFQFGPLPLLGFMTVLTAAAAIVGLRVFGRDRAGVVSRGG